MTSLSRLTFSILISFAMTFFTSGCGNDDPSDGGPVDTTPPVVTTVAAIDGQHVEVTFDENVSRASAENTVNYSIVAHTLAGASAPNPRSRDGSDADAVPAQTEIVSAALLDGQTVLLSLSGFMQNVAYDIFVDRVSDVQGNLMTGVSTTQFQGSDTPDTTPPSIISLSPAPNSTGVGTSQPIVVVFTEPMQDPSVFPSFSLVSSKGKVAVAIEKWEANQYVFSPVVPMDRNTLHTALLSNTATDLSGNPLSPTSWAFRTTGSTDTTPPALVSTTPIDGATNVPTDGFIELDFSEPIDHASTQGVMITPVPGDGIEEWFDGGRRVRFTPYEPLLDDTQYLIVIPAGFVEDLAGNGNTESYTIQFTTGSSFAAGRIDGTLSGDPFSVQAPDPTGAIVIATTSQLFGDGNDMDILGIGIAATNDTYSILRLPDAVYYPFAILDSNADGVIDFEEGDAFGAYGVNVRNQDFSQDAVPIDNGSTASQVDFPLFDPVAICGNVFYEGTDYTADLTWLRYQVGAFDASTFDPDNPGVPVAGTEQGPLAEDPRYAIHELDSGLEPGTYYIGCFLDVNSNDVFDPDLDPSGYFANLETGDPLPVTVENGTDVLNINIHIDDPQLGLAPSPPVSWRDAVARSGQGVTIRRAFEKMREALRGMN